MRTKLLVQTLKCYRKCLPKRDFLSPSQICKTGTEVEADVFCINVASNQCVTCATHIMLQTAYMVKAPGKNIFFISTGIFYALLPAVYITKQTKKKNISHSEKKRITECTLCVCHQKSHICFLVFLHGRNQVMVTLTRPDTQYPNSEEIQEELFQHTNVGSL